MLYQSPKIVIFLHFIDQHLTQFVYRALIPIVCHSETMKEAKLAISEVRNQTPKELLNVIFFLVDIPFLKMPIVLRNDKFCNFKNKIMYYVIPFVFFDIVLPH